MNFGTPVCFGGAHYTQFGCVLWGLLVGLVRSCPGVGVVLGVGLCFRCLVLVVVLWVLCSSGLFSLGCLVGSVFRSGCLRGRLLRESRVRVCFGVVVFWCVGLWEGISWWE